MKKLVLVLSIMLFSVGTYAQHAVGTLTIQPKVGLNISNYTKSDGADSRIGLAMGAEFESQITNNFSLSVGALYSQQGAKVASIDASTGINVKATFKTDYINIPIMANVYVAQGLAIKAGIQPGFNIKSGYSASAKGVTVSGSLSDFGVNVQTIDFSVPVGLSYEYKNLVFDGRYNIGLTNVVKDDIDNSKHSVFQFTVGYKFNL